MLLRLNFAQLSRISGLIGSKLLAKEPAGRPSRARDAAAIFAMLEKDLGANADLEEHMQGLVASRVGPREIDDTANALQIANRARSVFVNDKLATTGVAEVMSMVLGDLANAETSKEHVLTPGHALPRINTPPQTPGEHIQHYVQMLANLERRPKD